MKAAADKTPDNKTQITANEATQAPASGEGLAQFTDNRPETTQLQQLQGMANQSAQVGHLAQLQAMANGQKSQEVVQSKKNNTGLPDKLKSGIENLSGMSMDDVKVHRNSDKPAQLNAHAYAQGTDIHLASGQEKHLPHEAWHVVQQKQGRVKPTLQLKDKVNVNDDIGLEKEADVMGEKALSAQPKNINQTSFKEMGNASKIQQLSLTDQGQIKLPDKLPTFTNTPLQLLLDGGDNSFSFINDVRGKKAKKNKKLEVALTKLYSEAKESKVKIRFSWLVKEAKAAGDSVKAVNSLINNLDKRSASERDSEISGDGAHIMGTHLIVDREFQEKRLDEDPGKDQVTRLVPYKHEVAHYQNYMDYLQKKALVEIQSIIEDTAETVANRMEDDEFRALPNNPLRKTYLLENITTPEYLYDDQYEMKVATFIQFAGNPFVITMRWEPKIKSTRVFPKIITARSVEGDGYVEWGETGPVKMVWGSLTPVLTGIIATTTDTEILAMVKGLNITLGVTQY